MKRKHHRQPRDPFRVGERLGLMLAGVIIAAVTTLLTYCTGCGAPHHTRIEITPTSITYETQHLTPAPNAHP